MIVNAAYQLIDRAVRFQIENNPEQLEPWLVREMDSCISNIFLNEDQDAFIQLSNLILYENMNGMTLAMVSLFLLP